MYRRASAGVICLPPPRSDPALPLPSRALPLGPEREALALSGKRRVKATFIRKVAKGLRTLRADAVARWAASKAPVRAEGPGPERLAPLPRDRALVDQGNRDLSRLRRWLAALATRRRTKPGTASPDQLVKLRRDLDTMRRRIDRMLESEAV